MIAEYMRALMLIFAAEMGDKTQILAMMFATRYKTSKVLLGIFIGSLLNHGLAVILGSFLGNVIEVYVLQMVAGIAFVGFSMWTLMAEEDDGEEEGTEGSGHKSAVMVVAMAFFVGELGDKTQLTAITLSLDAHYPVAILIGTVSGMIATSSLGIFVGSKIGDRIPEMLIKVVSSAIFLFFGVTKLVSATPDNLITPWSVTLFWLVVAVALGFLLRTAHTAGKKGQLTPYRRAAKALYDYAHRLEIKADYICWGVKHCGVCEGEKCAVGFIRHLAKEMKANDYDHDHEAILKEIRYYDNKFSKKRLEAVKVMNQNYLDSHEASTPGYEEVEMMQDVVEKMMAWAPTQEETKE